MEEYNLRRCERATIKCRATEEEMQQIFSKKRKVYAEIENAYSGDVELEENSSSPAASRISGGGKHEEANDDVKESSRSPDLEVKIRNSNSVASKGDLQSEGENSTSDGRVFSRETTPTSELQGDSEKQTQHSSPFKSNKKSSPPPTLLRHKTQPETMPSAAELEEFFAAAEKYEQKRFAEKYNYDIVKDVPLEGKYQWFRLLP